MRCARVVGSLCAHCLLWSGLNVMNFTQICRVVESSLCSTNTRASWWYNNLQQNIRLVYWTASRYILQFLSLNMSQGLPRVAIGPFQCDSSRLQEALRRTSRDIRYVHLSFNNDEVSNKHCDPFPHIQRKERSFTECKLCTSWDWNNESLCCCSSCKLKSEKQMYTVFTFKSNEIALVDPWGTKSLMLNKPRRCVS